MKFGKEAFIRYATRRAPGASTTRVQYGYASEPVALYQDALDAVVPREWLRDSQDVPLVNQEMTAVNNVMRSVLLAHEMDCAAIALDANNYSVNNKIALTTGVDQWTVANVDISKEFRDYKEAVRAQIGVYPNTLELSPSDFNAIAENNLVKDRFKYTSPDSLTVEMIARYLELETVVVGKAVSAENENADFQDVWTGSVLGYVPPEGERSMATPSFGYSYILDQHPLVEAAYWDRDSKSWLYGVEMERRPYMTGMSAGFLIENAS